MKVKIKPKFKKLFKKTKNHFREKYLSWIAIVVFIVVFVCLIYYWGDVIQKNSKGIQALSTIILVIITGIYASFTQKNVKLFKKQLTPNIKMEVEELRKQECNEEKISLFRKILQGEVEDNTINIKFVLEFFIRNKYAGAGTVGIPSLIIYFEEKSIKLKPFDPREVKGRNHNKSSFYLRGGERRAYKVDYVLVSPNEKNKEKILTIINNYKEINFKIEYKDSHDSYCKEEISSKKIKTVKRRNIH